MLKFYHKNYLLLRIRKTIRTTKSAKEINPKRIDSKPKRFKKSVLEETLYRR